MLGTLYIISAPSGCGKTTLTHLLVKKVSKLLLSVSYTTRLARPHEKHGEHYYFVDSNEFQTLVRKNTFLEYAKVFDNYYGTPVTWVDQRLEQGFDVIVEVDWQGARMVKQCVPNVTSIFLLPPTWNSLRERLTCRKQDTDAIINKRMKQARSDALHYNEYDYIVFNENLDQAVANVQSIVEANRLKNQMQSCHTSDQLKKLLGE